MSKIHQNKIQARLAQLPKSPGVYFFRNAEGEIIYIGKASILARRVKSYFQKNHRDLKTPVLVENIADIDWIEAGSEIEALFLEAEFIKRHKPVYNIELKDDKNFIFIRVPLKDDFPTVTLVRRPSDDKARYYGPFIGGYQVKQALKLLRRIFPYYSKAPSAHSSKLEYQIGVIPPPSIAKSDYRANIRSLMLIFEGKSSVLIRSIEKEMKRLAKAKQYEAAAPLRNQYLAMKGLSTKIVFGAGETFNLELDKALTELTQTLGLAKIPRRIECYDISNFAGDDAVSSMIVFTDGLPDQKQYRHFKMRTKGPNDFAMMRETLTRRFSGRHEDWPNPNLIIIDGGKGQLSSALQALSEQGKVIDTVGLAKRYETIIVQTGAKPAEYASYNFDDKLPVLHLIQRIRDEAHRFAVSYHTVVRKKRTQTSRLDSIAGVGPNTRKKLVRSFGGVVGIAQASEAELAAVVGPKLAAVIHAELGK